MPPRENFYKWCNLVRFGVYLDQIFYFKKFQKVPFFIYIFFLNYHFLHKFLKTAIFYG